MISALVKTIKRQLTAKGLTSSGSRPAGLEQTSEEPTPIALPPELEARLGHAIANLSSHPTYCQTIQSGLTKAINQWQDNPDEPNCLAILGSPVEDLAKILSDTLAHWLPDDIHVVRLFDDWSFRLDDHEAIATQLHHALETHASQSDLADDDKAPSKTLVVLPLLDWCFLRCVNGLDGVEILRDAVLRDRTRFWVVGCNHLAWEYLDHVCQISSYFEQTLVLPELSALELKDWLAPLDEQVDIREDPAKDEQIKQLKLKLDKPSEDEPDNWISDTERRYFERLADYSKGLSQVAASLWLRSLSIVEPDEVDETESESDPDSEDEDKDDEDQSGATTHGGSKHPRLAEEIKAELCFQDPPADSSQRDAKNRPKVKRGKISTPKLPSLKSSDRYVLFSLLLHSQMTLTHLALSLGDEENQVQAHVQILHRAGVVSRQQPHLRVKPSYYLSIRSDLERNNFLVGDNP